VGVEELACRSDTEVWCVGLTCDRVGAGLEGLVRLSVPCGRLTPAAFLGVCDFPLPTPFTAAEGSRSGVPRTVCG